MRGRVGDSRLWYCNSQELKTKYDIVLEAKARLEDEVDSLQSKVGLIGKLNVQYTTSDITVITWR